MLHRTSVDQCRSYRVTLVWQMVLVAASNAVTGPAVIVSGLTTILWLLKGEVRLDPDVLVSHSK